eukprot:Anaeramoba_ignava/a90141_120.p5 GENE.a90141_120~~a90141_120.p5  ORF type:complete len:255 (-),score=-0.49 a90141_120:1553-2317(-)
MEKLKISQHRRLTIVSLLYVLFAFFMLMAVTYAWFTLTNVNNASLIKTVSSVEAEYQYYTYNDASHIGSLEPTLIDNITTTGEDLAYELVPNPVVPSLIDGYIAPGERFSFAIKITNVGNGIGYLNMSFGYVQSFGYDLDVNRIQNALYYEVTNIVTTYDNTESADIKDNSPIVHYSEHFDESSIATYDIIKNVPLGHTSIDNVVIIFFDIVFDPTYYGEDEFGTPYTNSNIFMGQTATINHIYMVLSPSQEDI